jgi:3-methyladenine DNA glycosylase AlkC
MKANSNTITEYSLDFLRTYLIDMKPNVTSQRKIAKQVLEKINSECLNHYLKELSANENWICRSFSCFILPNCYQNSEDKDWVKRILFKLADDKDWRVRESAAWSFYKLLRDNFETMYHQFMNWGENSNGNVRRAIIVAAMKVGKHREEKYIKPLLGLIEHFLTDSNKYVQKAIIFAIGDGFLRYYPNYTFDYLKRWAKTGNIQVRWIVAMCLSMSEARKHVKESLSILKELSFERSILIQTAVVKALVNFSRKNPERIYTEIKMWNDVPNRDYIVSNIEQRLGKNV